jgi:hypothetical protein
MGPTPGFYLVEMCNKEGRWSELTMSPAMYRYFVRRFFKGYYPAVQFRAEFAPVE